MGHVGRCRFLDPKRGLEKRRVSAGGDELTSPFDKVDRGKGKAPDTAGYGTSDVWLEVDLPRSRRGGWSQSAWDSRESSKLPLLRRSVNFRDLFAVFFLGGTT